MLYVFSALSVVALRNWWSVCSFFFCCSQLHKPGNAQSVQIACNSGRGQERKPTHLTFASYYHHATSERARERGWKEKKKKKERRKAQKIPPDGVKEDSACTLESFPVLQAGFLSVIACRVFPRHLHFSYLAIATKRHLSLQLLVNWLET